MNNNPKKEFHKFLNQLKETNATLSFFSDFDKIEKRVEEVSLSLNSLNYLIGKKELRSAVELLWKRDSKAFEAMGILIAVRENKPFVDCFGNVRYIQSLFDSTDEIMVFLLETGLADLFKGNKTKDLADYVFGKKPNWIPMQEKTEADN